MPIEWKKVTWYSQILAIVVGLAIFGAGFWIGSERASVLEFIEPTAQDEGPITISYACLDDRSMIAIYEEAGVDLALSDGRTMYLERFEEEGQEGFPNRFANPDRSIILWMGGINARLAEDEVDTFNECVEAPIPV